METDIKLAWKGLERDSIENCRVFLQQDRIDEVFSRVQVGPGKFDYSIKVGMDGQTESFCFRYWEQEEQPLRCFSRRGESWYNNEQKVYGLEGCIDIDILFTPLTNSLPIKRLKLAIGESAGIRVVYIDPETEQVYAAEQRYTRLADLRYRFETVPNDFEAILDVDENGFVLDYPGLFVRQDTSPDASG